MGILLPIPSYTQICRRSKSLGQELDRLSEKENITDVVIDSAGLKVYGEGEWKVRQHGYSQRRTWRKLHLAVCLDSNEMLTENNVADCDIYPEFTKTFPETVERIYGDGAYDTEGCYQASAARNLDLITPPQKNAVFHKNAPPHMQTKNHAILEILGLGGNEEGRKLWKKLKVITIDLLGKRRCFALNSLFGNDLKGRVLVSQKAEVRAKCKALNIMTRLGTPESEWSAA